MTLLARKFTRVGPSARENQPQKSFFSTTTARRRRLFHSLPSEQRVPRCGAKARKTDHVHIDREPHPASAFGNDPPCLLERSLPDAPVLAERARARVGALEFRVRKARTCSKFQYESTSRQSERGRPRASESVWVGARTADRSRGDDWRGSNERGGPRRSTWRLPSDAWTSQAKE